MTIYEFQKTMEILKLYVGPKTITRLSDGEGTRYGNVAVPRYMLDGIIFTHSGSYYVVTRGKEIQESVWKVAMNRVGEKFPGGSNFWHNEIHSVRGLITIILMLEQYYSDYERNTEKLMNIVYESMFSTSLIAENIKLIKNERVHGIDELVDTVNKYVNVINPFGNEKLEYYYSPTDFVENLKMNIAAHETIRPYARLSLESHKKSRNQKIGTIFTNNSDYIMYESGLYSGNGELENLDSTIALMSGEHWNFGTGNILRIGFDKHDEGLAWGVFEIKLDDGVILEQDNMEGSYEDDIDKCVEILKTHIKVIKKKIIKYMFF